MTDTDRAAYTAGLRLLADELDNHPAVPLPSHGREALMPLLVFCRHPDEVAAFARAVGGHLDKRASDDSAFLRVTGRLAGLAVQAVVERDQVCERVVTGVETVTEQVPDPDAPTIEVTREVEQVRWECRPLLAGASTTSAGAA